MQAKFGSGHSGVAPNKLSGYPGPEDTSMDTGIPAAPYRAPQQSGSAMNALWVMVAGGISFLITLAVLQSLPERMYLDVYRLTGRLLWWAVILAVLCVSAAATVLVTFHKRNPAGKADSEMRHHVGRRFVKVCMFGLLFWVGWIITLFAAALLLMYMGR